MSTSTVYPSNNVRLQKQLSQYKQKGEFAEALHKLLFTIGLRIPKYVKRFLQWCSTMLEKANPEFGIGAFYHAEETIAEQMDCSTRTVRRAIAWLKAHGLLSTVSTWNYNEDKRGTDYKVFAELKAIKAMITALIKKDEEIVKKLSATLSATMSATLSAVESEQIPCESKDEDASKQGDSNSFIKDLNINPLLKENRIKENDIPKRYQINSHLKNRLELHPFFTALEKDKQYQVANKFQLAFIKTGADFQDRDCMDYVLEAYRRFINDIEKGRKKITKDYYGALYVYLESAIHDYRIELEQEEEDQQPSTFIIDREQQAKDRYEYKQQQAKKPKGIFGLIGEVYDMDNVTGDQLADWAFGNIESLPLKPEKRERKDITAEVTEGKWNAFKNWQEKNADKLEELPY